MAGYQGFVKKMLNIDLKTIFLDIFGKKDPDEFRPNGSQIYHGMQGKGKTLSMMYHGLFKVKRKYPKAIIVTNLHLRDYIPIVAKDYADLNDQLATIDPRTHYLKFETYDELVLLLRYARPVNPIHGMIFMIDEIHNYFHSHDSKSMPMWIVQVFSQQRKQKLLILGTVQDWEDLIKAIRRQIDNLISCNRYGWLITNAVVDSRTFENNYGEMSAPIKKRGFFFLTETVRSAYDTYQVIQSGREIFGGNDMPINVTVKNEDQKRINPFARKK